MNKEQNIIIKSIVALFEYNSVRTLIHTLLEFDNLSLNKTSLTIIVYDYNPCLFSLSKFVVLLLIFKSEVVIEQVVALTILALTSLGLCCNHSFNFYIG